MEVEDVKRVRWRLALLLDRPLLKGWNSSPPPPPSPWEVDMPKEDDSEGEDDELMLW